MNDVLLHTDFVTTMRGCRLSKDTMKICSTLGFWINKGFTMYGFDIRTIPNNDSTLLQYNDVPEYVARFKWIYDIVNLQHETFNDKSKYWILQYMQFHYHIGSFIYFKYNLSHEMLIRDLDSLVNETNMRDLLYKSKLRIIGKYNIAIALQSYTIKYGLDWHKYDRKPLPLHLQTLAYNIIHTYGDSYKSILLNAVNDLINKKDYTTLIQLAQYKFVYITLSLDMQEIVNAMLPSQDPEYEEKLINTLRDNSDLSEQDFIGFFQDISDNFHHISDIYIVDID